MLVGYARVSTADQSMALQIDTLSTAGCEKVFTDKEMKAMSTKKRVRLGDAAPDEHFIVFYKGKMEDIICPHRKAKKTSRK